MFSVARRQPLEAADVAVLFAHLGEIALEPALALLDDAERARAQRITSRDYRLQVVKARAALRVMLAQHTGVSPRSFQFDEQGWARPRLRSNPWGLHFSVSHSADRIALAISTAPIGIDIERTDASCDWHAIADVCFHPIELRELAGMDAQAGREAFFDTWTRKEAYLKAIGTGLDTDPASFFISDGGVATCDGDRAADTWYIRAIDAPAGYKVALASQWQHPRLIRCALDGALRGPLSSRRPIRARPRRQFAGVGKAVAEARAA